jgi:hypothetical protein
MSNLLKLAGIPLSHYFKLFNLRFLSASKIISRLHTIKSKLLSLHKLSQCAYDENMQAENGNCFDIIIITSKIKEGEPM